MRSYSYALLLALVFQSAAATTSTTQITPDMAQPDRGASFGRYSPDGQHYCEVADHFTDGAFELACTSMYPPSPMSRISGALVSGQAVTELIFLSDGQSVVYAARQDSLDREDFYFVPLDGSAAPIRLTDASAPPSTVGQVRYSAATGTLVFRRDVTMGGAELVIVAIASAIETTVALPEGTGVAFFEMAADGSFVVVPTSTHLYQVNLPAGTVTELDNALISASYSPKITADSQTVVYSAGKFDSSKRELYSVPAGGGAVHALSPAALPSVSAQLLFELSADSQWVGFIAATGITDGDWVYSLFVSPVRGAGSYTTVATDHHRCQFAMCYTLRFAVNSHSNHVIAIGSDQPSGSQTSYDLLVAPLDGSALATTLDTALNSLKMGVLNDQSAVVVSSSSDLVLYDLGGGPAVNLTPTLGGFSFFSVYSPAAQRVVFRNVPDSGNEALHSVDLAGVSRVKLSDTSPFNDGLCQFFERLMAGQRHVLNCENSAIFLPPFGMTLTQSLIRVDLTSGHAVTVASHSWPSGDPDVPDFREYYASPVDPQQVTYYKWDTSGGPTDTYVGDIDILFVDNFNPPQ